LKKSIKYAYILLMLFFLYFPIAVLMVFSFNDSRSRANWSGFSLRWYVELLNDRQIIGALTTTLLIAALATLFAVVLGTTAAVGIHSLKDRRKRTRVKKSGLLGLTKLSILSPEIVVGISLMMLFVYLANTLNFGQLGFYTLLLAHISFTTPYVVISVLPRLRNADESLYEAALDLGASPSAAFRRVLLPQIKPGMITGAMIAFTLSIDDVIISFFTAGNTTNLSIMIFSMSRMGISPRINALSTIMFVIVMVLLYVINAVDAKHRKNERVKEGT
jgi:spermidine/putrescine transport system permease protein